MATPASRLHLLNDRPIRPEAGWVLCWLTASRRATWNFTLDRAVEHAVQLRRPLLILEAIRLDYPWASARLHRFIVQGMQDNAAAFVGKPVRYYPWIESAPGESRGLLAALAQDACVVVTDVSPVFFLPKMIAAGAAAVPVCMEGVDSCGLLPLSAAPRAFQTAFSFRSFLQKNLPDHLIDMPRPDAFAGADLPPPPPLPPAIQQRWPAADLSRPVEALLPDRLSRAVGAVATPGGTRAATAALHRFIGRLPAYADDRSRPESGASSRLSPWLHTGHISPHAVFSAVAAHERWTLAKLGPTRDGSRVGFWGMSDDAESFLEELVTWRELGYTFCWRRDDFDQYSSLPGWARATLEKHAGDERPRCYSLDELERAATHDPLWNAAQRQLLREGVIHNYMRMLWGKKILEWSPSPEEALQRMIHLNNRWAIDGRDPNSWSGIFWVLGRFDRAWGPERPIYGTIRYMSSASTGRKFPVQGYLNQYTGLNAPG